MSASATTSGSAGSSSIHSPTCERSCLRPASSRAMWLGVGTRVVHLGASAGGGLGAGGPPLDGGWPRSNQITANTSNRPSAV